jgi:hypothetical protein
MMANRTRRKTPAPVRMTIAGASVVPLSYGTDAAAFSRRAVEA